MAQWDFEGAYLHWEPGEQTCHAETEPIPWKHHGGWSPLFALSLVSWALWGGWGRDTGPCPPSRHTAAMHTPPSAALRFPKLAVVLQSTVQDGVGERDPEPKLGMNHCPGLNKAKFGLV